MAEYHVGCGAFGIYAGTLNKDKRIFRNKSMEVGEQADILYHLLTEQMTKAEIKAESEE